jgi:predicted Fe-Mo cluster-binding NifX family protein
MEDKKIMIIAVATENNMVAQHFGRCPGYTIFKINDGAVAEEKAIPNPGHEPGFLPGYLAKMGVGCIIAGGMGPRAQSLFYEENIETYIGVSGPVGDVIEAYLTGNLRSGESSCDHPHGDHNCGG